jgi:hypothetical protein
MTTGIGAPQPPSGTGEPPLRRYEMWIRTVLSPAVVASFPVRTESTRVPRKSVRRLHVRSDRDVTAVVRRLSECGVEVLELRVVDVRA